MAFGQPSGPPATARQLRELTGLLEAAGHTGFRDARGPLGLTQRQAGGRFTRDEADALIARLEEEAEGAGPDGAPVGAAGDTNNHDRAPATSAPAPTAPATAATRRRRLADQLRQVPEDLLVEELRRRGWSVTPGGN